MRDHRPMKFRRTYIAGWTATLLFAFAAPAQADLPKLSHLQAIVFMDDALGQEFGTSYQNGEAQEVHCSKRLTRTKVKCQHISWFIGDTSYEGDGRIWLTPTRNHRIRWNYAFRIVRTNEFCISQGGTNCVETIRVR